jgi:hypothetical protein
LARAQNELAEAVRVVILWAAGQLSGALADLSADVDHGSRSLRLLRIRASGVIRGRSIGIGTVGAFQ